MRKILLSFVSVVFASLIINGENIRVQLPVPNLPAGADFKKALENRRTSREFASKNLSEQDLSNLLWAAYGINREDNKRTVPAARGIYSIELFVALADGVYKHNITDNRLEKISNEDVRKASDGRQMGTQAPLVLIMVGNRNAFGVAGERFSAVEAGAIMQNLYLYCAAYNLNTVVCGSFDNSLLAKVLRLPDNKYVLLTQIVGFPR